MLQFRNIKIIEDKAQNLPIKIAEGHLFAGPMKIQEAEEWEERLEQNKTPYILAEAETSLPVDNGQEEAPVRFARGYFLFVSDEDSFGGVR